MRVDAEEIDRQEVRREKSTRFALQSISWLRDLDSIPKVSACGIEIEVVSIS
jgi:hypothetical protein